MRRICEIRYTDQSIKTLKKCVNSNCYEFAENNLDFLKICFPFAEDYCEGHNKFHKVLIWTSHMFHFFLTKKN